MLHVKTDLRGICVIIIRKRKLIKPNQSKAQAQAKSKKGKFTIHKENIVQESGLVGNPDESSSVHSPWRKSKVLNA